MFSCMVLYGVCCFTHSHGCCLGVVVGVIGFLVCVIVVLWLFSGPVGVVVSLFRPVTESSAVARMSAMPV